MKSHSKTRISLYFFLVFFMSIHSLWGLTVAVTGSWSPTLTSGELESGAGSDFMDVESSDGVITLDVGDAVSTSWIIDVSWDGSLPLQIRRTGPGSGVEDTTIDGGESYASANRSSFFSGTGNNTGISLRLKLAGVSVSDSPGNYGGTLTFSIRN